MTTLITTSIFTSPAKVLVNTVNTVGVMGKGIAKAFKDIFPEMFSEYQKLCENKQFHIGNLWLYKTPHKWILNFPTKQHWRYPSKPQYIEAGLKKFVHTYSDLGITSIAFPKLGCGNGELDWENTVRPLMLRYLEPLPIDIFIHDFNVNLIPPEHRDTNSMRTWLRSEPRSLAFAEMWADLREIVGNGLTLPIAEDHSEFDIHMSTGSEGGLRIVVGSRVVLRLTRALHKYVSNKWLPRVIGPEEIFIPQEAMLDLWQNIRAFGFCIPRIMPEGLENLANYIMPLMARLNYMTPVEITDAAVIQPVVHKGLQLYAYPASKLSEASSEVHAVQPV